MKLRTIVGLAAIGFLYLNKRRGGEFTLDSFRQTARELLGRAKAEAVALKDRAEERAAHAVARESGEATERH